MSENDELESRIKKAKEKLKGPEVSPAASAMQYSIEMAAGFMAGGLAGWLTDRFFGTKPVFFIIFLILGIIGGFWNIVKLASRQNLGHIDRDKNNTPE